MNLHPSQIAAVYDCLRAFPPFKAWGLPHSDEVEFRVTSNRALMGECTNTPGIHVSAPLIDSWEELCITVAHEMVHMKRMLKRPDVTGHGPEFQRLAARVCKQMGWDHRRF